MITPKVGIMLDGEVRPVRVLRVAHDHKRVAVESDPVERISFWVTFADVQWANAAAVMQFDLTGFETRGEGGASS